MSNNSNSEYKIPATFQGPEKGLDLNDQSDSTVNNHSEKPEHASQVPVRLYLIANSLKKARQDYLNNLYER